MYHIAHYHKISRFLGAVQQFALYGSAGSKLLFYNEEMTESLRGRGRDHCSLEWEGTKLRLAQSPESAVPAPFRAASFFRTAKAFAFGALIGFSLLGASASLAPAQAAGATLEERKLPMRFTWVACQPDCRGWIGAVGIVTADTPKEFDDFARGRELNGAAIVLDSSGGSVNDAIALGRRWRKLGLQTTVGVTLDSGRFDDVPRVAPDAYCESMCVFLLLSGTTRYVPDGAHVRVHQIWMGDRADDARAASYTAQDLMIVERDIGRLAKFTFDMGGAGDLLSLALSVPPWEDLHELTPRELRLSNLITTETFADLPGLGDAKTPKTMAGLNSKPMQDRFVSDKVEAKAPADLATPMRATQTAEVMSPTGGLSAPAQPQR